VIHAIEPSGMNHYARDEQPTDRPNTELRGASQLQDAGGEMADVAPVGATGMAGHIVNYYLLNG
jgi:hypothetical protein